MGKNILPIILIILSIGIYYTYTSGKIDEIKVVQAANGSYLTAIENSKHLISLRDSINKAYSNVSEEDRDRLDKIIPNNIDNVRLIIDVSGIGEAHGLVLKNLHTTTATENSAPSAPTTAARTATPSGSGAGGLSQLGVVTISFSVTTSYDGFLSFLSDIQRSLRILDVSKITLTTNDNGTYDYAVELKTYWLK